MDDYDPHNHWVNAAGVAAAWLAAAIFVLVMAITVGFARPSASVIHEQMTAAAAALAR
jgi:hypothetical protein